MTIDEVAKLLATPVVDINEEGITFMQLAMQRDSDERKIYLAAKQSDAYGEAVVARIKSGCRNIVPRHLETSTGLACDCGDCPSCNEFFNSLEGPDLVVA